MKPVIIIALSGAIAALVSAGMSMSLRQSQPTPAPAATGLNIRMIEAGRDASGCEADEQLLGAYCYSSPPNSISASTVAFRKAADGKMSLSCFTGGSSIRIFCTKAAR